ncbi:MAG: leucine-rich repeat domain-containing protein [Promethearchaeia archaeon]
MKSYKLNKYLTVRLEAGRTMIYVNEKPFRSCTTLILNIPKDQVEQTHQINSIDEAADIYAEKLDSGKYKIPPETEFWAHCSNLQAWVENDYDTRLLHSNIAFPLLKELVEAGDKKALGAYKDEIFKRIEYGHRPLIEFLISNNYLKHLNREERVQIYEMLHQSFREKFSQAAAIQDPHRLDREVAQLIKKDPPLPKSMIQDFLLSLPEESRTNLLISIQYVLNYIPGTEISDHFYVDLYETPVVNMGRRPDWRKTWRAALAGLRNADKLPQFSVTLNGQTYRSEKQILDLSATNLTRLDKLGSEQLNALKRLRILKVQNKQLKTFSGLEHLDHLTELYLADNQLEQIDLKKPLKYVRYLDLRGNKLNSITRLDRFPALEYLILRGNPLDQIDGLKENAGLTIYL